MFGFAVERLNAHLAHHFAGALRGGGSTLMPSWRSRSRSIRVAGERQFKVEFVDASHQPQVDLADRRRAVIHRLRLMPTNWAWRLRQFVGAVRSFPLRSAVPPGERAL